MLWVKTALKAVAGVYFFLTSLYCLPALHVLRLHQNPTLCLDAVACAPPGGTLLGSARGCVILGLAGARLAERQANAGRDWPAFRLRNVRNPASLPAGTAE